MNETYSTGEIILRKGEISPFLYLIEEGRVKIDKPGETVFFLSVPDMFGEEGIILGKPSPYTAVAADESKMLLLKKNQLEEFFSTHPENTVRLIKKTVASSHDMDENVCEDSRIYISVITILLDSIDSDTLPTMETKVDMSLIKLAERTTLSVPSLRKFFNETEKFNDVRLSGSGEILMPAPEETRKKISRKLFQRYFQDVIPFETDIGKYNLRATYTDFYGNIK
ncbi:MAG: cyclic nucleotide-binding domain-containing protein [bacterium]